MYSSGRDASEIQFELSLQGECLDRQVRFGHDKTEVRQDQDVERFIKMDAKVFRHNSQGRDEKEGCEPSVYH